MTTYNNSIEVLVKSSRKTALLSLLGFSIVIFSIIYASVKLYNLENTINEKKEEISLYETKMRDMEYLTSNLQKEFNNLSQTQGFLLDFLGEVTSDEKIHLLDPTVDWEEVKKQLINLEPGKRKQAIFIALLLAWKDIPFKMGGKALSAGFDSPRFLRYVLYKVGIEINDEPGVRLSDTLMKSFEKVEKPFPGDLVFYKGIVGSFGLMYISDGGSSGSPVGIGTLQRISPLQVINLENINTPYFPLIGYYRVNYPDEKPQKK
jgi:cell wall-associated NlpC family hydrolase